MAAGWFEAIEWLLIDSVKRDVLTSAKLSALYGAPIEVEETVGGYYWAMPGNR